MLVHLGDYEIEVIIVRKNNKNIYFRFKDDGKMYVTCHRLVPLKTIKQYIQDNEKSLLKMYLKCLEQQERDTAFYYLGEKYVVVYDEAIKKVTFDEDYIYVKDEKMLLKWYKVECEKIFSERIKAILNNFNDIPKFSLRIRKMSSRWGVNNITKKIITLNSELLKKDVTLIDYVIVHELCHFYEANHSKRFWLQVEKRYPYYKLARKRLRVE